MNDEYSTLQDEEEDVPSDFFDDFLSNDFMDGLDVVDTWDDENDHIDDEEHRPNRSSSKSRRRHYSKSRSPLHPKFRDYGKGRSPRGTRLRSRRSRERGYVPSKRRTSNSRHRSQDRISSDQRRDPEKARRDMQKYKDKCVKDQEDKLISEKLKMVETGLMPPGTEMEADIASEKKTQISTSRVERKRDIDKYTSPPRKGRSSDRKRPYRHSRSPYSLQSRSRLSKVSRRMSPERMRYLEKRSSRGSPKHRSKPKSTSRDRQVSPFEREMRRKVNRVTAADFFENRHSRRDFVEEFPDQNKYYSNQETINEAPLHYNMPTPAPVPVPVPAPTSDQYFPSIPITEPNYDQSFFIGQQFPDPYSTPAPYQNPMPFVECVPHSNVVTVQIVPSEQPPTTSIEKNANSLVNDVVKEKETINKLFEDKQISLSDFLSMSAKHSDPSRPINVQKKIKVISLCQDAIKAISENSQLNGRFFLKKISRGAENQSGVKHQSPMRKTPFVRFGFTTASKVKKQPSPLQLSLNKLLASLGLLENSSVISTECSSTPIKEVPNPPSIVQTSPMKRQSVNTKGGDSVSEIATHKAKMCQTDFVKCQICEIRKARTTVDKETQCEISYSNFGTQVSDDDFTRAGVKTPFRDGLKNQSIAHLTPAQLMRQTLNQPESKQTSGFIASRGSSEVSSENPNSYRGDNYSSDFSRVGKSPNNFNNPNRNQFDTRPSFGNNRPNMFETRQFNPSNMNNTPVRGSAPMRASDFFEGNRQNFGNHPLIQNPNQQHSNKRTLLPNPNFKRNF